MEEKGISLDSFTDIYGTSIGALVGLLVVVGMTHLQIRRLLINLPIERIFQITSEGLLGFADYQGIDRGFGLRRICRHILTNKFGSEYVSFGQLGQRTGRHFVVNATDVRTGKGVVFGTQETPDVQVEDAIIASAAIPFLYAPVRIGEMVLVDGGVTNSLLLNLVPPEDFPTTIAVVPLTRVDSLDIRDIPGMAKSVYFTMANTSIQRLIETCGEEAKKRIIYINTPVDTTVMLGQEANDPGVRETLDFLGYTEANRSEIIREFGRVEESDTKPEGPPDQPSVEPESAPQFLPSPDEASGMTALPPPDTHEGPHRSLPPPIESRKEDNPPVAPLTYQPLA